jgi:hypothetical protein
MPARRKARPKRVAVWNNSTASRCWLAVVVHALSRLVSTWARSEPYELGTRKGAPLTPGARHLIEKIIGQSSTRES